MSKFPKPLFQSEAKCKAISAFAQKGCGLSLCPHFQGVSFWDSEMGY